MYKIDPLTIKIPVKKHKKQHNEFFKTNICIYAQT